MKIMGPILNGNKADDTFGLQFLRIIVLMPLMTLAFILNPLLWLLGVRYFRRHLSNAFNEIILNSIPNNED
jgi:hypothetical protein